MSTVVETLERARDIVEKSEHIKNEFFSWSWPVDGSASLTGCCINGAVAMALCEWMGPSEDRPVMCLLRSEGSAALRSLAAHIPPELSGGWAEPVRKLIQFNDSADVAKSDILDLLNLALALESSKESDLTPAVPG